MRALVFDTETTGLVLNRTVRRDMWPELIEFAGALVDWDTMARVNRNRNLIDLYSTLVKPLRPLDAKITEITKLTNADLAGERSFYLLSQEIKCRIENVDLVVAHNASFDVEIIDMEFERIGQKVNWPRVLCTVEQTISLKGYRLSLSALHEYLFGLEHEDAHRAAIDVKALVRVVSELRRREII